MAAYFARRLLLMIPTFLGITFVVFAITRFVPGGPIEQMLVRTQLAAAESGGGSTGSGPIELPDAVRVELEKQYHLDRPFYVAYGLWMADLLTGDLGESYKYNEPVFGLIVGRFPVSVYFGALGFVLAYLVCIPLGILKAIRHGSPFDLVSSAIVFVGYAIPGWALGAVLLVLFGGGSFWNVFPLGGFRSEHWETFSVAHKITDQLHHTFLPVLAYAAGSFATLTVLMKNALMENLGQDYVRTAYAKGLSELRVIGVHAVRNSLIPISTGLGHALALVMAGSYLVERVFNIDGIGYLGYTSIVERDYAVVMGILVFNTVLILVGNIVSDLLYAVADPRIRFG
ncbi:MAG: ABC transporter permease subunit [Myxococcota bacterium]